MTKLFKAGLAVLAIALLTSSALAFSPVWEPLPDVYVGGGDAIFTDAIDLVNGNDENGNQPYLSDQDNATTTLTVVFADGPWNGSATRADQETDGTATSDVTIDSKAEVNYAGKGDVLLGNNSLLGDAAKHLTTPADQALTFEAGVGVDAAVVLIASDGVTSPAVSKAFRVVGHAGGDFITFPVGVVAIDEWDVTADFAQWAFVGFGSPTPTSATPADALSIITAVSPATADILAWWQLNPTSTLIPSTAGNLLRAQWNMQSTAAVTEWPAVQMRFFSNLSEDISYVTVSANGYVPAAGNARTYENFYLIPAGLESDINVGYYVIDTSDAQGGTFTMNSLTVDQITGLDSLFSDELTVDASGAMGFDDLINLDSEATIGWSATADSGVYTVTGDTGSFEVTLPSPADPNLVTMAANTLYRLRTTISSAQAASAQPSFQIRMFDSANAKLQVRQLIAAGGSTNNAHMASASGTDYDAYLTSTGIDGVVLQFSFDIINNQSLSGTITFDAAVLSSVDLGQIP